MIRWLVRRLQRRFFEVFPDDQFATMVSHTLLTLVPAAGVALAYPRPWTAAVTSVLIALLYVRREARQVGGGRWGLANYSDLIGPVAIALTFLVAWMLAL